MSTNDFVNHMKDLKIPIHSHSIMSTPGVWQLEQEVCTQWTGSWARPEYTHNSTILFLKDAHSPRNFNQPPEVHRQWQYSLDNTKSHTMTFHHTTHFLCGWSKSTSTQSTAFLLQPDCACHTLHLVIWLNRLEAPCQANRGAWQIKWTCRVRAHSPPFTRTKHS